MRELMCKLLFNALILESATSACGFMRVIVQGLVPPIRVKELDFDFLDATHQYVQKHERCVFALGMNDVQQKDIYLTQIQVNQEKIVLQCWFNSFTQIPLLNAG